MSVTVEDVDVFLTELLGQGDWVRHTIIPDYLDTASVRFTTAEAHVDFRGEQQSEIRHYDRSGLIDLALDKRAELALQSDSYTDTNKEPASCS